jgi:hypothetical protein
MGAYKSAALRFLPQIGRLIIESKKKNNLKRIIQKNI